MTSTSVKAAIDTGGKKGLDTDADFKAAAATVTGDRLAFAYVDVEALASAASEPPGDVGGVAVPSVPAFLDDLYPAWLVTAVRADDGGFAIDTAPAAQRQARPRELGGVDAPVAPSRPTPSRSSTSTTWARGITRIKDLLASDPSLADGVKQVDDTLKLVGGFDAVTGWIGETGVAVTAHRRPRSTAASSSSPTNKDDAPRLLDAAPRRSSQLAGGASGPRGHRRAVRRHDDHDRRPVRASAPSPAAAAPIPSATQDLLRRDRRDRRVRLQHRVRQGRPRRAAAARTSRRPTGSRPRSATSTRSTGRSRGSTSPASATSRSRCCRASDKTSYEADLKPYLSAFDSVIATDAPGTDIDKGTVFISVAGN